MTKFKKITRALAMGAIIILITSPTQVFAQVKKTPKAPPPPPAGLEVRATPSQLTLCEGQTVQIKVSYWNMPSDYVKKGKRTIVNLREPMPRTPKIVEFEYIPIQQVPGSKGKVLQEAKGDLSGGVHYVHGSAVFSVKVALGPNVWKFTYGAVGHQRARGATVMVHKVKGVKCANKPKKVNYQPDAGQDYLGEPVADETNELIELIKGPRQGPERETGKWRRVWSVG